VLAQRYKILKQLGQGGFATVYKARDRVRRNRIVAIKQIHLEALDLRAMLDATDAYNREVNALSLMRSRYLPRIYNYFMDEQHWYIVLEYIAGKTLEEKLASQRRGFLPVAQVLDIGIALCEALQHLHMQQPPLIFRDVKPANVIITRSGRLYLIDFGTARHYRPGWKDTGPLGTPGYAAPEQYGKRAHTTPQSDIYSLGATLQTALIGKDPLEVRQQGIPPQRAKNIPQALLSELEHMQRREATRRPRNMAEVKQTLQEIKAQALSQKIKARGTFLWELFHETSAFIYISLMLIVLVDFAAFAEKTWPPLWLISCLISGIFTCLSSIFALREARQQNQAKLPLSEKISLIWKRLATSLPITLVITLLIYYLFDMLDPFGMGGYDDYSATNAITFGIIVGGGLVACLCWAGIHLVQLQAARKYARQKQQEMLLQQTIQHHP
jgi:serine/threonine protein kinase